MPPGRSQEGVYTAPWAQDGLGQGQWIRIDLVALVIMKAFIYWPSAHPATVPGLWVRALLSVSWDLVVGLPLGGSFEAF